MPHNPNRSLSNSGGHSGSHPGSDSTGIHLLIIDAQNDFCDIEGATLPVPGADADMKRLADFIHSNKGEIDAITLTLDSHYRIDIAHPGFWRQRDGLAVQPFTTITAEQVRAGDFVPRFEEDIPRALVYLEALETRGRYTHMVWPVHCEMGTWGHNLHTSVAQACAEWEEFHGRQALRFFKGLNPWTEHYSAIEAEVPDPEDPATQANAALLDRLSSAARLLVAGEAGSHCVKATVEDIASRQGAKRLVLLTDAMSPVPGFEARQQDFLSAMNERGATIQQTPHTFLP